MAGVEIGIIPFMNTSETCVTGSKEGMFCQIKGRLSLLIVLSVLLSTALGSLYQLAPDGSMASNLVFLGTLIPAIYILIYVVLELFKKKMDGRCLNIVRHGLLLAVGMFIFPITLVSFYKNGMTLGAEMKTLLSLSIFGIPFIAILILIAVIVGVVKSYIKKTPAPAVTA